VKNIYLSGGAIVLFVIIYFITNNSNGTSNKNIIQNKYTVNKQLVQKDIDNENILKTKEPVSKISDKSDLQANSVHYKDIFKEPKKIDTLKQIQETQNIKTIEDESQALIVQANILFMKSRSAP
jgi:hypothetical protein